MKDLLVFAKDLAVTAPSGVQLVSQVTLEIGRGKRIALLGASGAGKSLLTRALAGLLPENFTRSGLVREHLAEGQKKLRILYLVQQAILWCVWALSLAKGCRTPHAANPPSGRSCEPCSGSWVLPSPNAFSLITPASSPAVCCSAQCLPQP